MNTSPRGFIVPLLLVIIALLLAGGGAYVYTQQKKTTPIDTVFVTDPTGGWQEYKNGDFSIQLPPAVDVLSKQDSPMAVFTDGTGTVFYVAPLYHRVADSGQLIKNSFTGLQTDPALTFWRFTIADSKNTAELSQFVKNTAGTGCNVADVSKTEHVGDFYFVNITSDGLDIEKTQCRLNHDYGAYYSAAKNKAVAFHENGGGTPGGAFFSNGKSVSAEMWSSVSFSATQSSNQKTYTSAQYGFSFSYPVGWAVAETQDGIKLTSLQNAGSDVILTISPVSNKATNINCQPSDAEDVNSLVNRLHSAECISGKTSIGVSYTRAINTGQSTEKTYKQQYLTGYLLNSGISVIIGTNITDASGNMLPSNSNYTRVPATVDTLDTVLHSFNWDPRAAVQTGVTNRPIAARILSDNNALTEYEKALVARAQLSLSVMNGGSYGYVPELKFYDNKTAVFCTPDGKDGCYLDIYDINTLAKINEGGSLGLSDVESGGYIIAVYDSGIRFYKKGASNFQSVPNSSLDSKKETYTKQAGMGGGATDVTFDEPTRTITASVFKPVWGDVANPRIRTVKFVLP